MIPLETLVDRLNTNVEEVLLLLLLLVCCFLLGVK